VRKSIDIRQARGVVEFADWECPDKGTACSWRSDGTHVRRIPSEAARAEARLQLTAECAADNKDGGRRPRRLEVSGAVPQTAFIHIATRLSSSVPLNLTAHSPEDKQHDRRHRSARLERIRPKRLFQYITADLA
jgi:hypothetical protein